jgi:peptide/nickel transport system substrate-binding protein
VKFHDGTDFNADAVKFNIDKVRTSKEVVAFREVQSVDVVDNYTVRFNLSQYNPKIWPDLAISMGGQGGIVSPTAINTKGEDYCMLNPVGTGPFVISEVKPDAYVKYKKFDGYWQKGKPYLDGIELHFINDVVTAEAAFQAGEMQALAVTEAK